MHYGHDDGGDDDGDDEVESGIHTVCACHDDGDGDDLDGDGDGDGDYRVHTPTMPARMILCYVMNILNIDETIEIGVFTIVILLNIKIVIM